MISQKYIKYHVFMDSLELCEANFGTCFENSSLSQKTKAYENV